MNGLSQDPDAPIGPNLRTLLRVALGPDRKKLTPEQLVKAHYASTVVEHITQ